MTPVKQYMIADRVKVFCHINFQPEVAYMIDNLPRVKGILTSIDVEVYDVADLARVMSKGDLRTLECEVTQYLIGLN